MKDEKTEIAKSGGLDPSGEGARRGVCAGGNISYSSNCGGGKASAGVDSCAKVRRSCMGTALAIAGIFISLFCMLNFTCGIFEIPDNIPVIGNLDEVFFTMLFLGCLSYLGVEIPFLEKLVRSRKIKK